jgi:hypothetical protein
MFLLPGPVRELHIIEAAHGTGMMCLQTQLGNHAQWLSLRPCAVFVSSGQVRHSPTTSHGLRDIIRPANVSFDVRFL